MTKKNNFLLLLASLRLIIVMAMDACRFGFSLISVPSFAASPAAAASVDVIVVVVDVEEKFSYSFV